MHRFPALVLGVLLTACATPQPGTTPVPPTGSTSDIVIGTSVTIDSAALGEPRMIHIVLPAGYEQREERFPVLYLIDGGVQQDLLPVAGFAALAALTGQYREFILVGIQTNERRLELTTPSSLPYDLAQIPRNGLADEFRRFVVGEVRAWVDARYRTSGETLVLGESLAGFFIVDTFLRAPASFDHYIAVSPSLWWHDMDLARSAADRLQVADFPARRSLFLSVADEGDIQAGMDILVPALRAHAPASLTWWYEPMPQEHHHTIYNPATLSALRLILGAPREP